MPLETLPTYSCKYLCSLFTFNIQRKVHVYTLPLEPQDNSCITFCLMVMPALNFVGIRGNGKKQSCRLLFLTHCLKTLNHKFIRLSNIFHHLSNFKHFCLHPLKAISFTFSIRSSIRCSVTSFYFGSLTPWQVSTVRHQIQTQKEKSHKSSQNYPKNYNN